MFTKAKFDCKILKGFQDRIHGRRGKGRIIDIHIDMNQRSTLEFKKEKRLVDYYVVPAGLIVKDAWIPGYL